MPLRKKSLLDIVGAAFVWQFHKQAIRAGEPLSEPPAKQVAKVVLYASQGRGQDSDRFLEKSGHSHEARLSQPATRRLCLYTCYCCRDEAAESTKWRVESIYVKHETQSKAW